MVAIETANGENILTYYNPYCVAYYERYNYSSYSTSFMCVNFIFDLNGTKGPNTIGKDIGFITALYPFDSEVVAPEPLPKGLGGVHYPKAQQACRKFDNNSRLPNISELRAMMYNKNLLNVDLTKAYQSSTKKTIDNQNYILIQRFYDSLSYAIINTSDNVHCVKK